MAIDFVRTSWFTLPTPMCQPTQPPSSEYSTTNRHHVSTVWSGSAYRSRLLNNSKHLSATGLVAMALLDQRRGMAAPRDAIAECLHPHLTERSPAWIIMEHYSDAGLEDPSGLKSAASTVGSSSPPTGTAWGLKYQRHRGQSPARRRSPRSSGDSATSVPPER